MNDGKKCATLNVILLLVIILCISPTVVPVQGEAVGVGRYNVVWDSPSKDATGSMPLGNGDISANVWMEQAGDLCFYIGKTDAWGDNGRLLKVGKVRINIRPNPLDGDVEYRQLLNLEGGEIVFEFGLKGSERGRSTLRIWVDAHDPVTLV